MWQAQDEQTNNTLAIGVLSTTGNALVDEALQKVIPNSRRDSTLSSNSSNDTFCEHYNLLVDKWTCKVTAVLPFSKFEQDARSQQLYVNKVESTMSAVCCAIIIIEPKNIPSLEIAINLDLFNIMKTARHSLPGSQPILLYVLGSTIPPFVKILAHKLEAYAASETGTSNMECFFNQALESHKTACHFKPTISLPDKLTKISTEYIKLGKAMITKRNNTNQELGAKFVVAVHCAVRKNLYDQLQVLVTLGKWLAPKKPIAYYCLLQKQNNAQMDNLKVITSTCLELPHEGDGKSHRGLVSSTTLPNKKKSAMLIPVQHEALNAYHQQIYDSYSINELCADKEGNTPLHVAAKANNIEFIDMLINNGADISCENNNGETPLQLISNDAVKERVETGAEKQIQNLLDSLHKARSKVQKSRITGNIKKLVDAKATSRKILIKLLWNDAKYGSLSFHTEIKQKDITVTRVIGAGAFGKVCQAKWHNSKVAVKYLDYSTSGFDLDAFRCERAALSLLAHPNIISLLGSGTYVEHSSHGPQGQGYFLVMPLAVGSLYDLIHDESKLPFNLADFDIISIATDIASALQYLHDHKIIHRDIKPDNILITAEKHLLLADMGIARADFGNTIAKTVAGTCAYMAPELYAGVGITTEYSFAVDVFSFGVTIWELLSKTFPPQIAITKSPLPMSSKWPSDLTALLLDCLKVGQPKRRPTFTQILERLRQMPPMAGSSAYDASVFVPNKLNKASLSDAVELINLLDKNYTQHLDVEFAKLSVDKLASLQTTMDRYLEAIKAIESSNKQIESESGAVLPSTRPPSAEVEEQIKQLQHSQVARSTCYAQEKERCDSVEPWTACNVLVLSKNNSDRIPVATALYKATDKSLIPTAISFFNIRLDGLLDSAGDFTYNVFFANMQMEDIHAHYPISNCSICILAIHVDSTMRSSSECFHVLQRSTRPVLITITNATSESEADKLIQQITTCTNIGWNIAVQVTALISPTNQASANRYSADFFLATLNRFAEAAPKNVEQVPRNWKQLYSKLILQQHLKLATHFATPQYCKKLVATSDIAYSPFISWSDLQQLASQCKISNDALLQACNFYTKVNAIVSFSNNYYLLIDPLWFFAAVERIALLQSEIVVNGIFNGNLFNSCYKSIVSSTAPAEQLKQFIDILCLNSMFVKLPTLTQANPSSNFLGSNLVHTVAQQYTTQNSDYVFARVLNNVDNQAYWNIQQYLSSLVFLYPQAISQQYSQFACFDTSFAQVIKHATKEIQFIIVLRFKSHQLTIEFVNCQNAKRSTSPVEKSISSDDLPYDFDTQLQQLSTIQLICYALTLQGALHCTDLDCAYKAVARFSNNFKKYFAQKRHSQNQVIRETTIHKAISFMLTSSDISCPKAILLQQLMPDAFCAALVQLSKHQLNNFSALSFDIDDNDERTKVNSDSMQLESVELTNVQATALFPPMLHSWLLRTLQDSTCISNLSYIALEASTIHYIKPRHITLADVLRSPTVRRKHFGATVLSLQQKIELLLQTAKALNSIHNALVPVVYCNLNPSSIALEPTKSKAKYTSIRLFDFKTARFCPSFLHNNIPVVDWKYAAPELLQRSTKDYREDIVSCKIDIYAFGILCYELLEEKQPYEDCIKIETANNVANTDLDVTNLIADICESTISLRPNFTINDELTEAEKKLILLATRCWNANPVDRPSSAELVQAINALIAFA